MGGDEKCRLQRPSSIPRHLRVPQEDLQRVLDSYRPLGYSGSSCLAYPIGSQETSSQRSSEAILLEPLVVRLSSRRDVHPHMHRVNMLDWLVLTDFGTDLGQDLQLQSHTDVGDLLVEFLHRQDPLFAVRQLDLLEAALVDSQLPLVLGLEG